MTPKSRIAHLATMISVLALSGCGNAPVSNPNPDPYYASCSTICHAARADAPDSYWRDLKNMTVVMDQLRERQPAGERQDFGACKCKR